MERKFIQVEKGLGPQGRIAVVRFDRGDNINALSRQAMRELRDVPRDFEDDLATSVVILTGSAKALAPPGMASSAGPVSASSRLTSSRFSLRPMLSISSAMFSMSASESRPARSNAACSLAQA